MSSRTVATQIEFEPDIGGVSSRLHDDEAHRRRAGPSAERAGSRGGRPRRAVRSARNSAACSSRAMQRALLPERLARRRRDPADDDVAHLALGMGGDHVDDPGAAHGCLASSDQGARLPAAVRAVMAHGGEAEAEALRITLGRAAASGAGGRQSPGGGGAGGRRAPLRRRIRWKWVKVWRTSPRSRQSAASGGRGGGGASLQGSPGGRACRRGGRAAGRVSTRTAPSARSASQAVPWRTGFAALRRAAGEVGGDARAAGGAGGHPGADAAGRRARGADGGAEVHDRLGVVAGARRRA